MLTVINLSKQIGNFYLNNVNFKVNKGEYFVLLGPSGSGKSLLLEIIAGLQKPDQGKITLNNVNITEEKIQKRKVGIVFQDYALFPHMTVYENIIFSLSKKESKQNTIKELLKLLSIEHLLNRKP
ncbi:MAG TPA: ATP-binding cassette domain-containing protein, partial [Bacteroidales bacterium]|nr:ATP-binding cassette domain-containing protein [Bacteroidales bacterium]